MPLPPDNLAAWRPITGPLGTVVVGRRHDASLWVDWPEHFGHDWPDDTLLDHNCCSAEADVLERYFAGDAVDPATASCPVPDGPPFHRAAWSACRTVPRGSTMSYSDLARKTTTPLAARAAGSAMKSNPLPLFIPCHRIVSSHGGIGGFAGTSDPTSPAVQLKYDLLDFESVHTETQTPPPALTASSQGHPSCA